MNTQLEIKWIPKTDMESILPLAYLLNNKTVAMAVLRQRLAAMMPMGYRCIGAYDGELLIGICGIWTLNKLYRGKHLEPDNVYVLETHRNLGVGKQMMDFALAHAKETGCTGADVNVYLENEAGQRFWQDQGFKKAGYHMLFFFDNALND